jgi:uncharacterized membrane protein YfcA
MPPDITTILIFVPIAFLGAFVYGVTGFGAGLITIPLASHFYDVPFVLAVFALLDGVNAVRITLSQPRAVVREEALRLIPCSVIGVTCGVVLLLVLPARVMMLALGAFVLLFGIYSLFNARALPVLGMRWAYVAGFSGGITSAMFGAGGPPYAIYLSMRPHGKEAMRATLAVTSLVSVVTRIVAFALTGLLSSPQVWLTALPVIPAALIALWVADRVHHVLSRETVLRVIRLLLCVSGLSLVWRAVS